MNKTAFYAQCPKTRTEFVRRFNNDYKFRSCASNYGFIVIGDTVILPNGMVANSHTK